MENRPLARELSELRNLLLQMAGIVAEQFTDAVDVLLEGDVERAEAVVARDGEVDALELKVDRQCERVLALHQPVASDLRSLLAVEKINTDLERIGDHCRNIARNTPEVVDAPDILSRTHLREMSQIARKMLEEARAAFLTQDEARARAIPDLDDRVDTLHRKNFDILVTAIQKHPAHAEAAARLITTSKALERVSDHATNIAKSVVFLIEGEDLRHQNGTQPTVPEGAAVPDENEDA
jgi:phosphate transport system protein